VLKQCKKQPTYHFWQHVYAALAEVGDATGLSLAADLAHLVDATVLQRMYKHAVHLHRL
jgi:hypothetical protein